MTWLLCPWEDWFQYSRHAYGNVWRIYKPQQPMALRDWSAVVSSVSVTVETVLLERRWYRYGMAEEKTAVYAADGDARLDGWFEQYLLADRLIRLLCDVFKRTGRRVW